MNAVVKPELEIAERESNAAHDRAARVACLNLTSRLVSTAAQLRAALTRFPEVSTLCREEVWRLMQSATALAQRVDAELKVVPITKEDLG